MKQAHDGTKGVMMVPVVAWSAQSNLFRCNGLEGDRTNEADEDPTEGRV